MISSARTPQLPAGRAPGAVPTVACAVLAVAAMTACGGGDPAAPASANAEGATSSAVAEAGPVDAADAAEGAARMRIEALEAQGRARVLHALTPVEGEVGRRLVAAGWRVVPATLQSVSSATPDLAYVDVDSPIASDPALRAWLRAERGAVLYDSHDRTETPHLVASEDGQLAQFERRASAGMALVRREMLDEEIAASGTPLANYLVDLFGDGPRATAVLRAHGSWAPFHVDPGEQVNGLAEGMAAALNDPRLQQDEMAQAQGQRTMAEAMDAAAGNRAKALEVGTHERRYAPMQVLSYWKGFRIAGYHNVRTYCMTTTLNCNPIVESQITTLNGNTLYMINGAKSGVVRMSMNFPFEWHDQARGIAKWGPVVNAFFASTTVQAESTVPKYTTQLYSMTPDPGQIPDVDMTTEMVSRGFSIGGSLSWNFLITGGPSLGASGAYSFSRTYMTKTPRWYGANESSMGDRRATAQVGLWRHAYADDNIGWFQAHELNWAAANILNRQASLSVAGWAPAVTAQFRVASPAAGTVGRVQVSGWLGVVGEEQYYQWTPGYRRNGAVYNAWVYAGTSGYWTRPASMQKLVAATPRIVRVGRCVNAGNTTMLYCNATDA